jgi:hypothetical protein
MVNDKRIWLYGFVIMPNHIHLMWARQELWLERSTEQIFLKYTAQQIKFKILESDPSELELYRSTQSDRQYHFWERRPYKATMYNKKVAGQKLDYIHYESGESRAVSAARGLQVFISAVLRTQRRRVGIHHPL